MKPSQFALRAISSVVVLSGALQGAVADRNVLPRELAVTVRDVTGLPGLRPVTGGVPLAIGAAPKGSCFVLTNEQGERVPCQTAILARWKDESVRWVLLDFQAAPPAGRDGTIHAGLERPRRTRWHRSFRWIRSTARPGVIQTGTMRLGPATTGC